MNIEYVLDNGKPVIYLNSRGSNKERKITKIRNYPAHFFIFKHRSEQYTKDIPKDLIVEDTEFNSLFGDELLNIKYTNPKLTNGYEKYFKETLEADLISYAYRLLIDKEIYAGYTLEDHNIKPIDFIVEPRLMYLDIETATEKVDTSGKFPITRISTYDSYTKEYYTFVYKCYPSDEIVLEGTKLLLFDDERRMLKKFLFYVKKTDPDVYLGWNVDFDLTVLHNRCVNLKLPNMLSPMRETYIGNRGIKIKGRDGFDLRWAYRKQHLKDLRESNLKYCYEKELPNRKLKMIGKKARRMWMTDAQELTERNLSHCRAIVEMDEKCNLLPFWWGVKQTTGIRLEDIKALSRIADISLLREGFANKIVFPNKFKIEDIDIEKIKGASVGAVPGVYKNVLIFDFATMYPMLIMLFNISPETITYNPTKDDIIIKDDIGFRREEGLLPKTIKKFVKARVAIKKKIKEEKDGSKRKILELQNEVYKFITNTFYGQLNYGRSRIRHKTCGETVTELGRKFIEFTRDAFEESGFKVVGWDTDSIFALAPTNTKREDLTKLMSDFTDKLNNEVFPEFLSFFNIDGSGMRLDAKFIFDDLILLAKKHYIGLRDNELIVKGEDRSDVPEALMKIQEDMCLRIFNGDGKDGVSDYLQGEVSNILTGKYGWYELGKPTRITMESHQYKTQIKRGDKVFNKSLPPHVRGILNSNREFKTEFGKGDKPRWCWVKSLDTPVLDVIAFDRDTEIPPKYIPDYDKVVDWLRARVTNVLDLMELKFPYENKKKETTVSELEHKVSLYDFL